MKLKSALKYNLSEMIRPLIIFYSIIYAILICTSVLSRLAADTTVTFGGMETASMIFIFVMGLNSFKLPFRMFLQNGLTRKTVFKSITFSLLGLSAFMAGVDSLTAWIAGKLMVYQSTLMQLYRPRYLQSGMFVRLLDGFFWNLTAYFFLAMIGFLITAVFYRLNKKQKVALSVGVPVFISFVLPLIDINLAKGAITKSISDFFSFAWGYKNGYNPYYSVFFCTLFAVALGAVNYLLVKRAAAKD